MEKMRIAILGTRGIPAKHGGFESFTEHFALYLYQEGWQVTVYCQEDDNEEMFSDEWHGIKRVHIPVSQLGAIGTVVFDWKSTLHAAKEKAPILTLGYNTALFCIVYRLNGIKNVINMDGIEWRRSKWTYLERAWLYINEKLGAFLGNHLIADHPEIKRHLSSFVSPSAITVIPYCAEILQSADEGCLIPFNLGKDNFVILIARPEPENSILEIISAFSQEKRGLPLVVLGNYSPKSNSYHRSVFKVASEEVRFVGAIYAKHVVQALRFYSKLYIHGHTVGGTNPSLVEALGAGCPVLAQKNKFNRWVAGDGAVYFSSGEDCAQKITKLLADNDLLGSMRKHSSCQIKKKFTCDRVHKAYENLLKEHFF